MTGLKQCDISLKKNHSSEVKEALADFIEIANVNFDEVKANNENETAYCELVEYVRLCIVMFFQELKQPNPRSPDVFH